MICVLMILAASDMYLSMQDGEQFSGCFGIWALGSRWAKCDKQV